MPGLRAAVATLIILCFIAAAGVSRAQEPASTQPSEATWSSIKDDIFKGRPIVDGTGLVALDAPRRAEDAALVPISVSLTLPAGDTRRLKSLTLVIDENPAPVAGTFLIGAQAGVTAVSTRVRVNSYSYVHAVAELSDGQLYAVKAFVKASGGCSAPMVKNMDQAEAMIGQMKFRLFEPSNTNPDAGLREAQVMVRHPQNSGLQMDQVSRLYIPAFFIHDLKIYQGDALVLALEGGISISEDPNVRFNYAPSGAATFRVEATDTQDHVYKGEWPARNS